MSHALAAAHAAVGQWARAVRRRCRHRRCTRLSARGREQTVGDAIGDPFVVIARDRADSSGVRPKASRGIARRGVSAWHTWRRVARSMAWGVGAPLKLSSLNGSLHRTETRMMEKHTLLDFEVEMTLTEMIWMGLTGMEWVGERLCWIPH